MSPEKHWTSIPRAAVAANNLAWLYAEDNEKLDTALQLAQTAKSRLPTGTRWTIRSVGYYKKGPSTLAVAAFERSVSASKPDNPELRRSPRSLACSRAGDKDKARQSLERALKINANFDGADVVRKVRKSIV